MSTLDLMFNSAKESIPTINVAKRDVFGFKSSTDGYQPKFIKGNLFIKSQATIGGVRMRDDIVEIIASNLCDDLNIYHVRQSPCIVDFEGVISKGVVSRNFMMDGHTFISFMSFLEFNRISYINEELNKGNAVTKMKLCAKSVSEYCSICYEDYLRYLINMAVIDCLVANTDRHLRNFGVFKNEAGDILVPMIFDNGMGVLENTPYRDSIKTLEEADRYLYISPYGEDPFDMIDILFDNFDMSGYDFNNIKTPENFPNSISVKYFDKMLNYILRR